MSRMKPLKRAAEERGLPYSSLRDAALRGEFPVTRIGRGRRHQAFYVSDVDIDAFIRSRTERLA